MAPIDVAVLTAKDEEYLAFYHRLQNPRKWQGTRENPNQHGWTLGELPVADGEGQFHIALGLTLEQTNVPAALAALAAFSMFQPRYLIFVGIAGSLDENVRKGDVFIADYVKAYDYGSLSESGLFKPRAQFQEATDQALRTNASVFAKTTQWWLEVGEKQGGGYPTLHFGGLASGNAVIEGVHNDYFGPVVAQDDWLRAVDMESAGLALAVRNLRERGAVTGLMVVRGISDTPSKTQGAGAEPVEGANRETRRQWTEYASRAAAIFLEQFITHGFPYAPTATRESAGSGSEKKARRQIDPGAFAPYRSHFVDGDELPIIHAINDESYEASSLVPRATLELWWRANPLTIHLVSTMRGEAIGYWHVLPLQEEAYRALQEGRIKEAQLGAADILDYQSLKKRLVYLYITALCARQGQNWSAVVILDMLTFFVALHEAIGIDGILAQAVSDDPLQLMASFGMKQLKDIKTASSWVLESREEIDRGLRRGGDYLKRMQGMVPEAPSREFENIRLLLRR